MFNNEQFPVLKFLPFYYTIYSTFFQTDALVSPLLFHKKYVIIKICLLMLRK